MVEYDVPSCDEICQMLFCLAQKIRLGGFRPDVVVGVMRGGVVPARFLADLLDAEFLTLQVEFYVGIGQTKSEPTLKRGLVGEVAGKAVLLVDDIADSGQTLQLALSHVASLGASSVKAATLYYKPKSAVQPDFFAKQTERWVVFPWDLKEALREISAGKAGMELEGEVEKLVKAGLSRDLADKLLKDLR
ncbi:MAG: phosphoribosyltransferase family protein [Candidatus Bathyarchaeota archaeon]|nr:phosphoribosyltransferase family protein [Candidatus Bathyarchaeota archaeon]